MAANNQKKQILVISGIAFVVCAAAVGGGFYAQTLVDEVEVQVEAQNQAITAAQAKLAKIPALEKEVVILRENLGEYVKILPDDEELNDFVRMLHQFQTQAGSRSTKLTPSKEKKGNKLFSLIEYKYEMEATLWEMMRFVNLVENYDRFVNISEFSITPAKENAGSGDELTRDGDAIHSIRLTMQTYKYNGQSSGQEVVIPKYDDLRETLRDEIVRRMQAITVKIDKHQYNGQQGRRDIFVDPRFTGTLEDNGPTIPPEVQKGIVDQFAEEASKLREMFDRVQRKETTLFEQYALEKGLRTGVAEIEAKLEPEGAKITYTPLRVRWSKEVVTVVTELRNAIDDVAKSEAEKDPYLPAAEIEQLIAQMKEECESGYLEEARQRYEGLAKRLQIPETDARHALAVDAKRWHNKIVTAIDFRALNLEIEGVVVDRQGRSGVLLNGVIYEEGEFVTEDLLVKMVEEERIWFVFRGLTLVRTL